MGKRAREKRERRLEIQAGSGQQKSDPIFSLAGQQKFVSTNLEKICLFIITWGTYLVLFAPLLIYQNSFFPFVAPKTIFFRLVVEIMAAAYILLLFSSRRWRPALTPINIAVGFFLAVLILTSITGINFSRSFWSTYERMTGLFTLFHLFAFFIVIGSVFKKKEDWEKIFVAAVVVGILLSSFILLSGGSASNRGGGTIGNSSFMAAYLLFDIFLGLILFLTKTGAWRVFSGFALLIMVSVLLSSSARGGIFAFYVGLALLALGYLFFSRREKLKRMAWAIVSCMAILAIVILIFQPPFFNDKITDLSSEMKPRFVIWQIGLESLKERPLLGWGPENFNVLFLRHFNPCVFLSECGGEIWFDRAHNVILDIGSTSGILGLASYLLIFIVAILGLLKISKKVVEIKNIFFPLGAAVILLIYFAQNLLVFDMINSYLMFFLVLAFVNFLTLKKEENIGETAKKRRPINPWFGVSVIIAFCFIAWSGNIRSLQTAVSTARIIQSQKIEDASAFFQKSLNSRMEKYEPREQFYQKISSLLFDQKQNMDSLKKGFEFAESEMIKSVEANKLDFRQRLFLGRLYLVYFYFGREPDKLELAEQTLQETIKLSPTNQQGYWYLAEVKLIKGETEESVGLLKKTLELEPRLAKSHWYLAIAYKEAGEFQLAMEEAGKAAEIDSSYKSQLENFLPPVPLER